MPRHPLVPLFAIAWLAACYTGPPVHGFRPAQSGHGIEGQLRLRDRRLDGELLEIRDSAYVLISSDSVVIVPFGAVRDAHFAVLGSVGHGKPGTDDFVQLQLASRFPRGMTEPVLAQLLASTKQSAMAYLR